MTAKTSEGRHLAFEAAGVLKDFKPERHFLVFLVLLLSALELSLLRLDGGGGVWVVLWGRW